MESIKTGDFLIGKTSSYFLYGGKSKVNQYHIYLNIELKLKEGVNYQTIQKQEFLNLSVSGFISHFRSVDSGNWNCAGQIDDIINRIYNREGLKLTIPKGDFLIIMTCWEYYHLNDLKPGTINQVREINKWRKQENIKGWAYDQECEYLKSINLYQDMGIKWGYGWFFESIPINRLNQLKNIIMKYCNASLYKDNLATLQKWYKEKSFLSLGV